MRRAAAAVALALLLPFAACAPELPDGGDAVSASATEYIEPETTLAETEAAAPPETEPEGTKLEEIMPLLPPRLILEVSERLSEVYRSYTRKTETLTETVRGGEVARSQIYSELLTSDGNAAFRRTADGGNEEYFLIDGFLCYGGSLGNYRYGGYDISSFSELAGNYFSLEAFDGGAVETDGSFIALKFDKLTETGIAEITEMLALPEGYSLTVTKAEYLFVTDTAAHMKEKKLTLEATVTGGGEELSFTLTSHTEQTGINEENDLALPPLTSYTLISDPEVPAIYEAVLADIGSFFADNRAFELIGNDEITVGGALDLHLTEKTEYAYAEKIGASVDRMFTTGNSSLKHVLTHFNHRRGFSQINGGNIFVDSTLNAQNLEATLTEPFRLAQFPFSAFSRIDLADGGRLVITLNNDGKLALAREILLTAGIYAQSLSITSCKDATAYFTLSPDGKVTSLGYSFSAIVTADGKTYTLSRTHTLEVTKRGSANVKVIFIEVDEEEEELQ